MKGNFRQRLDSLTAKTELLVSRYEALLEQNRLANDKIAELEAELQRSHVTINRLEVECENLRVVTTIAPKREDVEKSRSFLLELVRDIDKCISELTD